MVAGDPQKAGAQALVVVHDVEPAVEPAAVAGLLSAPGQQPGDAQTEGPRLREPGGPHRGQFQQVDPVADLAGPGRAERVRFAVEVEAGHLGEPNPRIEALGVGLSGEHLHPVPEFGQTPAEVTDVDALAAAMGLAAVRQQCHAHAHAPAPVVLDMCPRLYD